MGAIRFTVHKHLPRYQAVTTALIIGGNVGGDAGEFVTRFPDLKRVFVFEPIPKMAEALRQKFAAVPKLTVLQFGIDIVPGTFVRARGAVLSLMTTRRSSLLQCRVG